ncbi:HAD hydrolase family protein [Yersinia pekkanenii]
MKMTDALLVNKLPEHLCQYLNISSQSVVSIGDQDNDISMFQFSAVGVAMANARE